MYSLQAKHEDILGWQILDNKIYHKVKNDNYRLYERNIKTFEILWRSDLKLICDFATCKEWIVFDSDDNDRTIVVNRESKELYWTLNNRFAFGVNLLNDKFLLGNSRRKSFIIDILSKEVKEYEKEDYSFVLIRGDDVICRNKLKTILSCRSICSDLLKVWHFDITQFGPYRESKIFANQEPKWRQREINRVYYHNNKIIVTLSRAIIALNPDNGELLWKIDFENYDPVNLLFDGNIAYLGRLIYFAIIDIEKGIKLFEKDFDPAYRFEVEGFKLSQIRYIGLTLHENHLWFTHEDKGHQFLLKANPQNGDIINGMLLETKLSTYPPLFDENRMYLLDQEGVLWIYEIDGND